jgi:hypothetical protein
VPVENLEDLGFVGFGVGVKLLAGERRTGGVASGGIADEAGAVSDKEDDGVTEILEVLELADEHGVAKMKIGRSGIKAGLDAQRLAAVEGLLKALAEIALTDDFDGTFAEVGELVVNGKEGDGRDRGHDFVIIRFQGFRVSRFQSFKERSYRWLAGGSRRRVDHWPKNLKLCGRFGQCWGPSLRSG